MASVVDASSWCPNKIIVIISLQLQLQGYHFQNELSNGEQSITSNLLNKCSPRLLDQRRCARSEKFGLSLSSMYECVSVLLKIVCQCAFWWHTKLPSLSSLYRKERKKERKKERNKQANKQTNKQTNKEKAFLCHAL